MSPNGHATGGWARMARVHLAASLLALATAPAWAPGQETTAVPGTSSAVKPARPTSARHRAPARDTPASWKARHGLYFQRNWGVDIVGVRRVASGFMLRFDYRVVDPVRASVLSDPRARPYLIDEATRTALAVPAMEKVGELRQVAPLESRRTYFMIFGNPGGLVKRGGKVSLVVGDFRADGLVVD
jgi:hypothetical protein